MDNESLERCRACGKHAGELIEEKAGRFPFRVQCRACGWSNDAVKIASVATNVECSEARAQGQSAAEMSKPAEAGRDIPALPVRSA